MPPKESNPVCIGCKKTEALLWTKVDQGQFCEECLPQRDSKKAQESERKNEVQNSAKNKGTNNSNQGTTKAPVRRYEKRLRKSVRTTRFKAKQNLNSGHSGKGTHAYNDRNSGVSNAGSSAGGSNAKNQFKGRSRRTMFKKAPQKTPSSQATTHYVESLFYKGSYLQIGDIVSLVDSDGNVYYAQIRGLLVDNYCEKSAFLTWLIPTHESPDPKECFDAATYLIGPDEELSRKLSCLEFVMHAPSNYYLDRSTPYPLPDVMDMNKKPGGYIWTTLPDVHRNKTNTTSASS